MKKLYSTDIVVYATAYILAGDQAEAREIAQGLANGSLEFVSGRQYLGDDIWMTGESFNPDMPAVSLSPAMTIAPLDEQSISIDLAEEFDDALVWGD